MRKPIVRQFCLTLAALALTVSLHAQSVRVTLDMREARLKDVIESVEGQTRYLFAADEGIDMDKRITIRVQDATLRTALDQLAAQAGLEYTINGSNILLSRKPQPSQQKGRTVSGRIVDANGDPLIGAGVFVEGHPEIGTITDFDGNYSLQVPADAAALRISYIGMTDAVASIDGQDSLDVVLQEDENLLEGVVVTALGIKRAEKAVTYNVQKLDEKVFVTREANMVNSLAGKIAGVQINETAAGAGGETKVVMRGAKSISGNNNALYVLDGIPLPTLSTTKPGDSWSIYAGSGLSGDGMSMLNSEDIADMSALVGASAAALYGYKAANGILMLTSRTGEEGIHVTYSNNTTFSSPLILPGRQSEYGAKTGSYASWGDKLESAPSWNIKDFFQTGYNTAHSFSLSAGRKHSTSYLSAGYTDAQGIIPNNNYDRFNATFRHTADFLNDRLHLSFLAMYIRVNEQNMLSGGLYHNPLVPLYLMSPSDNLYSYTVYERYNPDRNFPTQYWGTSQLSMQNPFWTINRNMFQTRKNRYILGGSVSYDITKWMDIQARVRTDNNATIAEQKHYASSNGLFAGEYGRYYYDDQKTTQTYADVLLNINKTFGENSLFSVNAVLGASIEDYYFRGTSIGGDLLGVANLFTFTNMETGKAFSKDTYRDQTQSVFGTLNLGFKNFLFVEATAREDWASQMARGGKVTPFFYPSVGGSLLVTEMFDKKSDFIPYAKVRASYAEVGNPISRYILNVTYPVVGGMPNLNTWSTAPDFQPERTRSWEAGADVRLFKSKLQLSGTYYHSSTYNQVFTPTTTSTGGSSVFYVNAGQVDNRGVELSGMFTQDIGDFNWTTNLIWTRNVNKVVKMLDYTNGKEHYVSSRESVGGTSGVTMWLIEGRPVGEMYVAGLATNEDGTPYVTPSAKGGVLHKAPNDGTPDTMWYAGNVNPDWTGSWRNQFSWKGLNLAFMFTMRKGGVGVSLTEATMDGFGVTKKTLTSREEGFDFAPADIFGTARNYYHVSAQDYWQTIASPTGGDALGAYYVYDMTNIRLAEVSLGYNIPVTKLVPWIENLNVAVVGRNLALLLCKAPFDPEQISSAGNYGAGIDLFMAPSTRNIGFSVKVTFGKKDNKDNQ
jgi:TonB-linked SusC/RagA family outer membrane protein